MASPAPVAGHAKRRRLGVPGGNRAPLGTIRDGRPIAVGEAALAIVCRAYELASAGLNDRGVAAATGLAPTHVAEVLTNPFYAGRLLPLDCCRVPHAISSDQPVRARALGSADGLRLPTSGRAGAPQVGRSLLLPSGCQN